MSKKEIIKRYLCGKKALDFWKVPNIRGVIEPENIDFTHEYVLFTRESLYCPDGTFLHTCGIEDAKMYTSKEGVCTLPLVFLQVATLYSIHELIYLGLQICSYRKSGKPLCSFRDLEKCARKLRGHRGRRKALRAIRYLDNGSRSPMESILYMFLRLPNALGGCGFTEIKLNHRIDLKKSGLTYYADLYLPSCKLDIEYDSQTHHDNAASYSRDNVRSANLEQEGYQVLSVKPTQIYDLKHFETLARNISKRSGKRLRIRARKFFEGFRALRDLLKKGIQRVRSRYRIEKREFFPRFPGVSQMYAIYIEALKRLANHPNQSLVLTRAP